MSDKKGEKLVLKLRVRVREVVEEVFTFIGNII